MVRQFVRFCAVGVVGFTVDSTLTLALASWLSASPFVARAWAFILAATATWLLNRRYTFRTGGGLSHWLLYVALTGIGGLMNIGVYLAWVERAGSAPWALLLGVLWGSCFALIFNFLVSKYIVFLPARRQSEYL